MSVASVLILLATVALLILGFQSTRLYLKNKITPALLFCGLFYTSAILAGAAFIGTSDFLSDSYRNLPPTVYGVALAAVVLISAGLGLYIFITSRLIAVGSFLGILVITAAWVVVQPGLIGSGQWFKPSAATYSVPLAVYLTFWLPTLVTAIAVFGTLRQFKEAGMSILALVRLVLIGALQALLCTLVVIETMMGHSAFIILPFVYMFSVVSVVLALLSLLTPISGRRVVEHPVY